MDSFSNGVVIWIRRVLMVVVVTLAGLQSAFAGVSASVFIFDPASANDRAALGSYLQLMTEGTRGDSMFALVDPRSVSIVVDGISDISGAIPRGSRFEEQLQVRVAAASVAQETYNLVGVSELLSQFVLAHPSVTKWDFYFLGSIKHQDDEFSFEEGYPNDGFIFLSDSEFGYVERIDVAAQIDVHVFYSDDFFYVDADGGTDYRDQYDRFMALWADEAWGANLVSFNDGLDKGNRPAYDSPPLDRSIVESAIVARPTAPACETTDALSQRELSYAKVEFTVSNPCRAGAYAIMRVGGKEFTALADGSGVAKIVVDLQAGLNVVELQSPEGETFNNVSEIELDQVYDAVEIFDQTDEVVSLKGYHPLRQDGSLVTIRDRQNDREWRVPVLKGEWVLDDIPLAPGTNIFDIVQTDGNEVVTIPVENENDCGHGRSVEERPGMVYIVFNDSCLANQTLTLHYLGEEHVFEFDAAGRAQGGIVIYNPVNRITYDLRGVERLIEVLSSGVPNAIRVTLEWRDNIDLDMHIYEPDGSHVFHDSLEGKFGEMDFDDIGVSNGLHSETYLLPISSLSDGQEVAVTVRNFSRRVANEDTLSEHCEGGRLEAVPFTVTILSPQGIERRDFAFEPFECDVDRAKASEVSIVEVYNYVR